MYVDREQKEAAFSLSPLYLSTPCLPARAPAILPPFFPLKPIRRGLKDFRSSCTCPIIDLSLFLSVSEHGFHAESEPDLWNMLVCYELSSGPCYSHPQYKVLDKGIKHQQ